MPHSAIEQYMNKLEKHHAILRLMMGEAAKLPHLEEDGRRDWARSIEEILYGDEKPKKVSSPAMLKMIGIGVEVTHG
jgi:hypothetical protein